jgi:hypothetical protein
MLWIEVKVAVEIDPRGPDIVWLLRQSGFAFTPKSDCRTIRKSSLLSSSSAGGPHDVRPDRRDTSAAKARAENDTCTATKNCPSLQNRSMNQDCEHDSAARTP